jgi:predicted amidohydrolase
VELVLLVAEWPQSRIEHWQKLLQARAIENQFFVAAVNKVGTSQGQPLGGKSALIDPGGHVLAEAESDEGLLTGRIQLGEVEKARRWIPILQDRNPEAYQRIEEAG